MALGVYRETENNIFRFKIVLKDKPMARRGKLAITSSIFWICSTIYTEMQKDTAAALTR